MATDSDWTDSKEVSVSSDSSVRKRTSRLLLEFSLVFASVILALLADEWRSSRADSASERRALALVLRDLDADAEDLSFFRAALIAQQDAGIRFLSSARDGPPGNSLSSDAEDALRALYYRPNHPTYQGLVQSGQLSLIRDDAVRDALVAFHEGPVAFLDEYRDQVTRWNERAAEQIQPYLRWQPTGPLAWEMVVVGDLAQLARDSQVLGGLAQVSREKARLARRIDVVILPAYEQLRADLVAHLAQAGQ